MVYNIDTLSFRLYLKGELMKTTAALVLLVSLFLLIPAAHAVNFDWAIIASPGNPDDVNGYGGVAYTYRISKHEVTNAQYCEFLNAVDPVGANTLALYDMEMAGNFGGIELHADNANGSKFVAQAGRDQHPATWVTFFDAMRFTNWLHNGQGDGGTETGAYTIGNGLNEVRMASASYWIPSEDEWYKAAYYDPSGVYYDYPTGRDIIPYSDDPSNLNTPDNSNVANFFKNDTNANGYDEGYAVSGLTTFPSSTNPLTDVGAYSMATSPYGTWDQGGNVLEWNEAVISPFRGLRGGSWNTDMFGLRSDNRTHSEPSDRGLHRGFRVASIPEPSTILFSAMAACGPLVLRKR